MSTHTDTLFQYLFIKCFYFFKMRNTRNILKVSELTARYYTGLVKECVVQEVFYISHCLFSFIIRFYNMTVIIILNQKNILDVKRPFEYPHFCPADMTARWALVAPRSTSEQYWNYNLFQFLDSPYLPSKKEVEEWEKKQKSKQQLYLNKYKVRLKYQFDIFVECVRY